MLNWFKSLLGPKENPKEWTALSLILAVTLLSLTSCAQTTGSQNLDVESFAASISSEVLLVDVRTPGEWKEGVIEGAIMVDFYSDGFMEGMMALDSEKPWVIYCRSGNRSGQALAKLKAAGQVNVKDLQGGVKAWVASGRSLVSPY